MLIILMTVNIDCMIGDTKHGIAAIRQHILCEQQLFWRSERDWLVSESDKHQRQYA